MAIQDDNTVLCKGDLKAYHEQILPYLGGNLMLGTNVSDYYSTDEKIVGVWTDGKPVYQKTIDLGVLTNNKTVNHNISNIDIIIDVQGMAYNSSGQFLKLTFTNLSNSYYGSLIADKTKISILTSGISDRSGFVILRYTKTTDASNSAVTTPGCYDINRPDLWPANKEIFFGNGLYGFRGTGTYNVTANTPTSKTITTIITNAKSTTKIFNYGGTLKRGSGASSSDTILGLGYGANVWTSLLLDNTGLVMYNYDTTARSNIPYDIWVTYTK